MTLRPGVRLCVLFCVVTFMFYVSQHFEQHKTTAYSCRALRDCFPFSKTRQYQHELPVEPTYITSEIVLRDGTREFERRMVGATPDLLFLILNRDGKSWSRNFNAGPRSSYDLLDVLISTNLNLSDTSISMMTSSEDEYKVLQQSLISLPFGRTTVLYRNDSGPGIPYKQRHQPELQLPRRAHIAKLRNYLMLRALRDEEHILWIDADVTEFSPNIVQTMLSHSATNSTAGIITARCSQNHVKDYDKNAWLVDRNVQTVMGAVPAARYDDTVREFDHTRKLIADVIAGSTNEELRPLDAVGGTILYIRAELIRQGVNFPVTNIVGTSWSNEGWVGVETEGLCYLARTLAGGRCWALGGSHHVRHSNL